MNEQTQAVITEILTKALKAVEQGAEFLAGELPEVVEQLLIWHFVSSILTAISGVILLGSIIYFIRKQVAWWNQDVDCEYGGGKEKRYLSSSAPLIGFNILLIFPIIHSLSYIGDTAWLKIWVAPKLFLLEYAASIVK